MSLFRRLFLSRLLCHVCGIFLACHAVGAEWHVAPDGSDEGDGSKGRPFATVRKAQERVSAGDTVYLRGGTYRLEEGQVAQHRGMWAHVIVLDKSGRKGSPIRYEAYGDEKPVLDFSAVKPEGKRVTAVLVRGSWLHLKGFEITGVQVTMTGHTQSICVDNQGSENVYENLVFRDGQAIGFWLGRGSNNLVLNCDAHDNHDFTSGNKRGGNVDGFGFHVPRGSKRNVFRGCRAWHNSDDGFDFISAGEAVTVEECWAFSNGTNGKGEPLADGNGFKAGGYGAIDGGRLPAVIPRHVVRRCVAVRNRAGGFYANHHPGGIDWIHNTAMGNRTDFNFLGRNEENTASVPGGGHRILNNVAYPGRAVTANFDRAINESRGNTFDVELKFDRRDFLSLDHELLKAERRPDGGLPEVPLFRLSRGSRLIDRGVDLGEAYRGKAPDPGAYEAEER